MGIKDINTLAKKLAPSAFRTIPLKCLSGYAIAIDTSLWLFKAKSSALKDYLSISVIDPLLPIDKKMICDNIIKQMYGFVFKFFANDITPVWVFDGPSHPEKIKAALKRRKIDRDAKKINIDEERKRILSLSPLERTSEIMNNFKKMLLSQISIGGLEIEALKMELQTAGIPVIQAPYDGEILASVLSQQNKVIGVWTLDSDAYVSGARAVFTGFSKIPSEEGISFDAVIPSEIYGHLEMDLDNFRDFCIMLQCDFNARIPKLGPVSALKLFKKYHSLEAMMEKESYDWDLLNISNCRSLLTGPLDYAESIKMEDLTVDAGKWLDHLKTKEFYIDPPNKPSIVSLMD